MCESEPQPLVDQQRGDWMITGKSQDMLVIRWAYFGVSKFCTIIFEIFVACFTLAPVYGVRTPFSIFAIHVSFVYKNMSVDQRRLHYQRLIPPLFPSAAYK